MRYLIWCLVAICVRSSVLAESDYIPLAVGNHWQMSAKRESSIGPSTDSLFHRRLEGTVEKEGKTYFRVRMWSDGPTKGEVTEYVRKDNEGYYTTRDLDKTPPERELILPLKVGAASERKVLGRTMTITVVGLESVTVSGKTYENCFHIREVVPEEKYTKDTWLAPNVGVVTTVSSFPTSTSSHSITRWFCGS